MPYTAEITRDNPTFFLFLVDQSRSMQEDIDAGGGPLQKAVGVADSINRWLSELSVKCAKIDGIRDYYSVGVIGYGKKVGPGLGGELAGRDYVQISEIAEHPVRLEERTRSVSDGEGGSVEQNVKVPVWFDPVANGATPMCRASDAAHQILTKWLTEHPDCFPPIVINITDGEATDGEPTARLNGLTSLSSSDGDVTLFNIHLSANPDAQPIIFPATSDDLPDAYSRTLFDTASPLTPAMRTLAEEHTISAPEGTKAFVLNADMTLLVQAIDIGTRPASVTVDGGASQGGDGFVVGGGEAEAEADGFADSFGVPGEDEFTVILTVEATGEVIESTINYDDSGMIVGVNPAVPLDPRTEYRLQSVPAASLQR